MGWIESGQSGFSRPYILKDLLDQWREVTSNPETLTHVVQTDGKEEIRVGRRHEAGRRGAEMWTNQRGRTTVLDGQRECETKRSEKGEEDQLNDSRLFGQKDLKIRQLCD